MRCLNVVPGWRRPDAHDQIVEGVDVAHCIFVAACQRMQGVADVPNGFLSSLKSSGHPCLPLGTDRDRQTSCGRHDSDPWQPIGESHGHAPTPSTAASARCGAGVTVAFRLLPVVRLELVGLVPP